jgi:hypothetical protein
MAFLPTSQAVDTITGEGYTSGIGEGYYTEYSFINYCPLCHHYNTLETYVKGVNEITCTHCDADYSYSGRDKHEGYARAWLTSYVEPEPPVTDNDSTTNMTTLSTTPIQTPLEKAQMTLLTYKIL